MSESIFDMLKGQLDGPAMDVIAGQLGTDRSQTERAVPAALGSLMAGLARNSSRSEGAGALAAALDRDHDGSALDNLSGLLSGGGQADGAKILGHVFGGREGAVESAVGQSTGLQPEMMKQLLSMLAPMVLGALGKAKRQRGLDPGGLAGLLDEERRTADRQAPGLGGMLGGLLDADGDGDTDLGDALKLAGKFFGKRR